jgi:hypothetical protein
MNERFGRTRTVETLFETQLAQSARAHGGAAAQGGGMLVAFPLLLIPVAVYNLMAILSIFSGSSVSVMSDIWFHMPMPSPGTEWAISIGDVILFVALICLFFELLKSTSSDNVAIINHTLSLVLFIVCLVEFLLLRSFATSTFFFLTMMVLLDVVAGFIVTAIAARKDIGL